MNWINNEHLKHKNEWKYWIKVPLSCLITYRGFKALVQATQPDDDVLFHGN